MLFKTTCIQSLFSKKVPKLVLSDVSYVCSIFWLIELEREGEWERGGENKILKN